MPNPKNAIAVGVLVLSVALFIPTLVDGTQNENQDISEIENGTTYDVNEKLSVSVTSVNVSNNTSKVEVTNTDTLESSEKLLNVSKSKVYTIGGENVTAKLEGLRESPRGEFATVTVTYPPTFGFGQASKTFFENVELMIVLVGFIIVLSVLGVVSKT